MKIAIIGTGYVGLPTGVGLAELGYDVTCIDKDTTKIETLRNGHVTLYEQGLAELLDKNIKAGRIHFTESMQSGIESADVVIIAVGTPPNPETGAADMKYIYAAAAELAKYLSDYTVIATKSTVPVGTGDEVAKIIATNNPGADFDVVSLPEFLREGFAVHDFFHPDRIIVGTDSERAKSVIAELYAPFADKTKMLYVSRRSSEIIKYASNAFLAIKIHYINEMADFCERTGADVSQVAAGMGLDKRIGDRFLTPGPGYGGSCFPKDTMAMAYMGNQNGANMSLIKAAISGNSARKEKMAHRVLDSVKDITAPKIAVLGLAFKDGTDDCRQSPAIEIIEHILACAPAGLKIRAYDPQAINSAKSILGDKIEYAADMYDAISDADAIAILTEWPEFSKLDLQRASNMMRCKQIIDLRNIVNAEDAETNGFSYSGIGKRAIK